jgi:putative membrane protein
MFLALIGAIALGILAGVFTGLAPGIHINLISALLVSSAPILLTYTNALVLCCFIIAMSITHTFLDSLPSIFLGAPEAETVLGVLPGHRYLLRGQGMMAVKLTIFGCLASLILCILLFPLFMPIVQYGYPLLEPFIGWLILAAVVFMLLRDDKKLWALLVFGMSGAFGLIVFDIETLKDPLFPMLSGLFGISTMLISLAESQSIPPQVESEELKLRPRVTVKALLSGIFSGFITATMPGLGASTAAVISMQITRKLGDHGFMILMGAINTANFVLSLVTFMLLAKARNGSIIAVQKLMSEADAMQIWLFLSVALVAGCVAAVLGLAIGRAFARLIARINYRVTVIIVIASITGLTVFLSGWIGLIVMLTGTAIGILPAKAKVTRTHAMGCLLVPVMIYFLL